MEPAGTLLSFWNRRDHVFDEKNGSLEIRSADPPWNLSADLADRGRESEPSFLTDLVNHMVSSSVKVEKR